MAYGISFIQYFRDYHPQEAKEPAKKAEQTKGQFFGISFGVSFVMNNYHLVRSEFNPQKLVKPHVC